IKGSVAKREPFGVAANGRDGGIVCPFYAPAQHHKREVKGNNLRLGPSVENAFAEPQGASAAIKHQTLVRETEDLDGLSPPPYIRAEAEQGVDEVIASRDSGEAAADECPFVHQKG